MKKNVYIAITVAVVIVIILIVLMSRKPPQKKNVTSVLPTEELIPTVDKSVNIDLVVKTSGKEVTLTINNMPKGTQTIEYSLSYDTQKQSMQGVIGTITVDNNKESYSKDITLGTCSSGHCVYHDIVGAIKLSLKFSGAYGEKIFEKDYTL